MEKITGLSNTQIEEAIKSGKSNAIEDKNSKGYWQILRKNLFSFFNICLYSIGLLLFVYSLVLSLTGRHQLVIDKIPMSKYGFLIPLTLNIIIATIQEFRSKRTLDHLKLVNESQYQVYRDGKIVLKVSNELVLGDFVKLKAGQIVPFDGIIHDGFCEVDESILSGESKPVKKQKGDKLLAGSSLISGSLVLNATAVGKSTYAASLSEKVKTIKKSKSALMTSIYKILNTMSFLLLVLILVVIGTLTYKIAMHGSDPTVFGSVMSLDSVDAWCEIVVTSSAFAIGVVPTGLVLLTSMVLALGIIRLAKQNTLIQELYSLEKLSQVNCICLDKTGTLTDGTFSFSSCIELKKDSNYKSLIAKFLGALEANSTSEALIKEFGEEESKTVSTIPFSSERKFSSATFETEGELSLGAPEMLSKDQKILEQALPLEKQGFRALLFTQNKEPIALFFLQDSIRESAKTTVASLQQKGVVTYVISGDNLDTISRVAKECGIAKAESGVSLHNVKNEDIKELTKTNRIFARVTPEQKEIIVASLKEEGAKVAMVGDGVNDILALRKADCAVTFQKGADAAKRCSDIILLDNDFSHFDSVISEGRRAVKNIERTAILFLIKTVFVFLLGFFLIPFKAGQAHYSVENVYLLQTSVIAIGGFFLSLESSKDPRKGTFEENVYPHALSGGLLILVGVLLPIILNYCGLINPRNEATLISLLAFVGGVFVMVKLSYPFTKYRVGVIGVVIVSAILLCLCLPRAYLGGQGTSLDMIKNGTVWHELFQPWNCPVYQNLFSDWFTFVVIAIYVFLLIPGYFFLDRFVAYLYKKAALSKAAKNKAN